MSFSLKENLAERYRAEMDAILSHNVGMHSYVRYGSRRLARRVFFFRGSSLSTLVGLGCINRLVLRPVQETAQGDRAAGQTCGEPVKWPPNL